MSCWYIVSNCPSIPSRPQSVCSSRSSSPCSRPTSACIPTNACRPYLCCYVPSYLCSPCSVSCSPCSTPSCSPSRRPEKISDFAGGGGVAPDLPPPQRGKGKAGPQSKGRSSKSKGSKSQGSSKTPRPSKSQGSPKGKAKKRKSRGGKASAGKITGGGTVTKEAVEEASKENGEDTKAPKEKGTLKAKGGSNSGGKDSETVGKQKDQAGKEAGKEGGTAQTAPAGVKGEKTEKPDIKIQGSTQTPGVGTSTVGVCTPRAPPCPCPNPYCPSNIRRRSTYSYVSHAPPVSRPPPRLICYCKRKHPEEPTYEICPKCGKKKRPKQKKIEIKEKPNNFVAESCVLSIFSEYRQPCSCNRGPEQQKVGPLCGCCL